MFASDGVSTRKDATYKRREVKPTRKRGRLLTRLTDRHFGWFGRVISQESYTRDHLEDMNRFEHGARRSRFTSTADLEPRLHQALIVNEIST
jgi:hypothetical protein